MDVIKYLHSSDDYKLNVYTWNSRHGGKTVSITSSCLTKLYEFIKGYDALTPFLNTAGEIPKELGELSSLDTLDLSCNKLSGKFKRYCRQQN